MKKLTKKIERETLIKSLRGKILKIELTENQEITFREHRKKTRYSVHLSKVYKLAIICAIVDEYSEKLKEYKEKKKAGKKGLRMPKKPTLSAFDKALKLAACNNNIF